MKDDESTDSDSDLEGELRAKITRRMNGIYYLTNAERRHASKDSSWISIFERQKEISGCKVCMYVYVYCTDVPVSHSTYIHIL